MNDELIRARDYIESLNRDQKRELEKLLFGDNITLLELRNLGYSDIQVNFYIKEVILSGFMASPQLQKLFQDVSQLPLSMTPIGVNTVEFERNLNRLIKLSLDQYAQQIFSRHINIKSILDELAITSDQLFDALGTGISTIFVLLRSILDKANEGKIPDFHAFEEAFTRSYGVLVFLASQNANKVNGDLIMFRMSTEIPAKIVMKKRILEILRDRSDTFESDVSKFLDILEAEKVNLTNSPLTRTIVGNAIAKLRSSTIDIRRKYEIIIRSFEEDSDGSFDTDGLSQDEIELLYYLCLAKSRSFVNEYYILLSEQSASWVYDVNDSKVFDPKYFELTTLGTGLEVNLDLDLVLSTFTDRNNVRLKDVPTTRDALRCPALTSTTEIGDFVKPLEGYGDFVKKLTPTGRKHNMIVAVMFFAYQLVKNNWSSIKRNGLM